MGRFATHPTGEMKLIRVSGFKVIIRYQAKEGGEATTTYYPVRLGRSPPHCQGTNLSRYKSRLNFQTSCSRFIGRDSGLEDPR